MQTGADMTVVVTSCNRHDLLARILVTEDGDADPCGSGKKIKHCHGELA